MYDKVSPSNKFCSRMSLCLLVLGVLAVFVAVIAIDVNSAADDSGICGENATYSYNSSTRTLTISGTGPMDDYCDCGNMPWCNYRGYIRAVEIMPGITTIGNYAFMGCDDLPSINIPGSVETIGSHAFYECRFLQTVTIESGLTTIGPHAFYFCEFLQSITLPDTLKTIEQCAFSFTVYLSSITIPGSVETIGDHVFSPSSLSKITFAAGEGELPAVDLGVAFMDKDGNEIASPQKDRIYLSNGCYFVELHVKFDANGGTFGDTDQAGLMTVAVGADGKIKEFPASPTKDNVALREWNTLSTGAGDKIELDREYFGCDTVYAIYDTAPAEDFDSTPLVTSLCSRAVKSATV